MKKLYSPKQAAKILSLSKDTILKLIKKGDIKASNVGTGKRTVYRIYKSELQSFLERKDQTNEQPRTS